MPVTPSNGSRAATYRAGIVGCGRIGCGFDDDLSRGYVSTHAGAYFKNPRVDLVALADLDQEKLDRYGTKYNVPGRYQDLQEMLAREHLDILSVCTWVDTHQTVVEQAVAAGVKAVFCEKPIAQDLAAAEAIIRCCANGNTLLMIDHQRRFDRFHQEVAGYLRDGHLGSLQQATCYYTAGVTNTGVHLFDLLRFFLGEVEWVQGIYSAVLSPNPQDPNLDGWLKFDRGTLAAVQACDVNNYMIFEINLLGTAGRLRVASAGFDAQFEEARESSRFSGYRELYPAPPPVDPTGPREFMLQAVDHLLDCLDHGQKPACSGEDGQKALEIICALLESAEAGGRRIDLPLAGSPIVLESR